MRSVGNHPNISTSHVFGSTKSHHDLPPLLLIYLPQNEYFSLSVENEVSYIPLVEISLFVTKLKSHLQLQSEEVFPLTQL